MRQILDQMATQLREVRRASGINDHYEAFPPGARRPPTPLHAMAIHNPVFPQLLTARHQPLPPTAGTAQPPRAGQQQPFAMAHPMHPFGCGAQGYWPAPAWPFARTPAARPIHHFSVGLRDYWLLPFGQTLVAQPMPHSRYGAQDYWRPPAPTSAQISAALQLYPCGYETQGPIHHFSVGLRDYWLLPVGQTLVAQPMPHSRYGAQDYWRPPAPTSAQISAALQLYPSGYGTQGYWQPPAETSTPGPAPSTPSPVRAAGAAPTSAPAAAQPEGDLAPATAVAARGPPQGVSALATRGTGTLPRANTATGTAGTTEAPRIGEDGRPPPSSARAQPPSKSLDLGNNAPWQLASGQTATQLRMVEKAKRRNDDYAPSSTEARPGISLYPPTVIRHPCCSKPRPEPGQAKTQVPKGVDNTASDVPQSQDMDNTVLKWHALGIDTNLWYIGDPAPERTTHFTHRDGDSLAQHDRQDAAPVPLTPQPCPSLRLPTHPAHAQRPSSPPQLPRSADWPKDSSLPRGEQLCPQLLALAQQPTGGPAFQSIEAMDCGTHHEYTQGTLSMWTPAFPRQNQENRDSFPCLLQRLPLRNCLAVSSVPLGSVPQLDLISFDRANLLEDKWKLLATRLGQNYFYCHGPSYLAQGHKQAPKEGQGPKAPYCGVIGIGIDSGNHRQARQAAPDIPNSRLNCCHFKLSLFPDGNKSLSSLKQWGQATPLQGRVFLVPRINAARLLGVAHLATTPHVSGTPEIVKSIPSGARVAIPVSQLAFPRRCYWRLCLAIPKLLTNALARQAKALITFWAPEDCAARALVHHDPVNNRAGKTSPPSRLYATGRLISLQGPTHSTPLSGTHLQTYLAQWDSCPASLIGPLRKGPNKTFPVQGSQNTNLMPPSFVNHRAFLRLPGLSPRPTADSWASALTASTLSVAPLWQLLPPQFRCQPPLPPQFRWWPPLPTCLSHHQPCPALATLAIAATLLWNRLPTVVTASQDHTVFVRYSLGSPHDIQAIKVPGKEICTLASAAGSRDHSYLLPRQANSIHILRLSCYLEQIQVKGSCGAYDHITISPPPRDLGGRCLPLPRAPRPPSPALLRATPDNYLRHLFL